MCVRDKALRRDIEHVRESKDDPQCRRTQPSFQQRRVGPVESCKTRKRFLGKSTLGARCSEDGAEGEGSLTTCRRRRYPSARWHWLAHGASPLLLASRVSDASLRPPVPM
jgi:hypothetical protein